MYIVHAIGTSIIMLKLEEVHNAFFDSATSQLGRPCWLQPRPFIAFNPTPFPFAGSASFVIQQKTGTVPNGLDVTTLQVVFLHIRLCHTHC